MIISFSATEEEVQKLDMLRTAMRHSTRSDVLRHILADAYDKIFAKNLPIGNISCPAIPEDELARLDRLASQQAAN